MSTILRSHRFLVLGVRIDGTVVRRQTGITCQSCTDACEAEALRFDMRVRPSGTIRIDRDACTGCGACIAVCPASAITVRDDRHEAAA